jgi:hypothetical protein
VDAVGQALPTSVSAFWSSPVPADRWGTAPGRAASAPRPDVLPRLCGPLAVEPFGDLGEVLRPAYLDFTAERRAPVGQEPPRSPT